MDHIEAKREQARQHRGVWYDVRADKFVAEVYSQGDRHFLGHFDTAEAASDAYALARAEMPSGRSSDDTFVKAFQSFLDSAERDGKGTPLIDEMLTYKGQDFLFAGVVFRAINRRRRPFYAWSSICACGAPYETLTATTPAGAKGITRTCEEHRRGGRKKAQPVSAEQSAASAPQEWIDAANAALDAMSLVADEFEITMFIRACYEADPSLPRSFPRFLLESPQSPVIPRDDKFFPRNT